MEVSDVLKNEIKDIQSKIIRCIQNHQAVALRLKEDPGLEAEIKVELTIIQKQIVEFNDQQKVLIRQLKKELEENITNGQLPVYNFNLYKVKPGQLESKKRRRKDLSLAPKVVSCRPTHSPPSLSPSPTPSSSSLSDDSVDYVSPSMMPIPVPKARPKLLPDVKDNAFLATVNRRDLRPARLKKNQKPLSDEEVFKDIPVYYDPVPSPPPVDEKDLKARFMGALALIPKEMLSDILNRKVERKRRSTATNNPNFVYNNDWEIPAVSRYNQWKRSKTYLSPHKVSKIENSKKSKGDDYPETRQLRKEREAENDKAAKLNLDDLKLPPGLVVEKVEGKSRNSTPDSSSSNALCFICRSSGSLITCRECNVNYHSACVSPSSSVCCPNCKHKRSPRDEASSEESSKEEFISKCPNVAESYTKLKKYIEHHTEVDTATAYTEREQLKMDLLIKNQELYDEKNKLEEKATQLSEALLVQEDSKNELLKEEKAILAKIKVITDFVKLFQKTNEKKIIKANESGKKKDSQKQDKGEDGHDVDDDDYDGNSRIDKKVKQRPKTKGKKIRKVKRERDEEEYEGEEDEADESDLNGINEETEEKESEEEVEKYLRSGSSRTVGGKKSEPQPSSLAEESMPDSPKEDKNSGIFEVSKASLFIDISNTENSSDSPSPTSKDSILELDVGEGHYTLHSIRKCSGISDAVEYETPSSEPEFY